MKNKVKSFAKAVWAFCSYLFWPQKNKRCLYDNTSTSSAQADMANAYDNDN